MRFNFKTLTKEEIDSIWVRQEEFKTDPYLHQKISIFFGLEKDRAGFFHDVGTGKTIISLYLAILKDCNRILIVAPNSVKMNWAKEIFKHTNKTVRILDGSTEHKKELIKRDQWATIVNYESLRWIYMGKDKKVDKKMLKEYADFDLVIFDEIHKVKNWKAQQSKVSLALSKKIKQVIGLTGTPLGNSLLDLFNEIKILDLGEALGNSFLRYRREFFDEKYGFWASEWTPKENAERDITERLKEIVIRYEKEECLDLPERVYETRSIQMTPEQTRIIEEQEMFIEGLGKKPVPVLLSHIKKISQITGGTIKVGDSFRVLTPNPKLEELLNLIEEIDGKIVIFHEFVAEGRIIASALRKKKYKVSELRGETKDRNKELLKFQNDPEIKVMVAHPVTGGIGIDLYQASTMIFYSNGYSYLQRHQCEGRIHRAGQTKKCLYIDLIAEKSIDEDVYEVLMNKKNLSDRILEKLKGGKL